MTAAEKVFRTKTGFCQVLPEQLVLTRDGVRGTAAEVAVGSSMARPLLTYCLLAALFLYFAVDAYREDRQFSGLFFGTGAAYLLYGVLSSLNNSAASVINRDTIRQVRYVAGISGLTRSHFEVRFEESGKLRKRLIILPGTLEKGREEAREAVAIMREAGLLPAS